MYEYTYDSNGNITSDGRHTYVYNEQNQLFRVMDGQTVLGEYTYNAKGQRVKKVTSSTTIYHYDLIGNLIQETTGSGNVIASYVYAGNMRLAKVESSGTIYYYHNDHLGTPLAMTDTSGAVVWKAAYNPFGKAEVDPSSTVTNNFRFPGQYFDAESGLHYNWFRYYDPGTGRYVTADLIGLTIAEASLFYKTIPDIHDIHPPIHNVGAINLYTYVENNPSNEIDSFGLLSKCKKKVIDDAAKCIFVTFQIGDPIASLCIYLCFTNPIACGTCLGIYEFTEVMAIGACLVDASNKWLKCDKCE